ncbi:MAG: polysaccharide biosynthesis tyrosine autokinase [Bacteroidetes bacterium]|nr:polysaccharide biosynthesis tyrosine autokinase [Bacteroidota bacterium]
MKLENNHIEQRSNFSNQQEQLFGNFDFNKLTIVIKRSILWVILIIMATNLVAYLIVRYTKPIYQSTSDLKLDVKSDATVLGIQNPNETFDNLAGEIELIKSKLFFNKVIDAVSMDVTYNYYGKILTEERYKTSPFKIDYKLHNRALYDIKFDLDLINDKEFRLSYQGDGQEIVNEYRFGLPFSTPHFDFVVNLSPFYNPETSPGKYFFTINSRPALIKYIEKNIQVIPLNLNANIIRIAFKDYSPYKAGDLVNAIDTLYLDYTRQEKNKATKQQIDFINTQLEQTEKKLEAFEDYFESFTIENKTTNLQTDIGETIELLEEIESKKYQIQFKLINTKLIIEEVQSNQPIITSTIDPKVYPENVFQSLAKLNDLVKEKELLLASHSENTFVIRKKVNEIDLYKSSLLNLLNDFKRNLSKELNVLKQEQLTLEKNFKELPSLGTEYSKNRRLYALYNEFYISQIQKKAEFEIAQAGTVTNFVILSSATLPEHPIHPQIFFIYGIGIASGLFLSIFLIGVKYALHNKITSQSELENLSLAPFLGIVPHLNGEKMAETKLIIHENPKSAVSEALRSIRTNMDFLSANKKKKIISITSTVAGEGKTFISVNLGAIIALSNVRVVIIDLDMRKPKIHLAFSDENGDKGVSTILIDRHSINECIRKSSINNLDYIPAGPTPPNPSELLLSDTFGRFLKDLKEVYDIVILDTPPVGLVTDGILAMKQADLPVYIIRADFSKKEFVNNLNRLISVNKFKNLAVVLNSLKSSKGSGYGYGYGYGGSRYYESEEKKKLSLFNLFKF